MKKYVTIWIFIATLSLCAQQQRQISFNNLSVNDGLSQNSVVSIAQDSTGYLWFATQDGLNKYDGKKFIQYQAFFEDITRDSYSRLGKVFVDNANDIYIITINGRLQKLNRSSDTFDIIPDFLNVGSIFQDAHDTKWIGTFGNGLYKLDATDTLQVFHSKDLRKDVYAISQYDGNTIVAASESVFLFPANTPLYESISPKNTDSSINFSSIATTENKTLWVGSFGYGLFKKSPQDETLVSFEGFSASKRLPSDLNIESLLVDSKDRLWIGTYGDGAYLLDFTSEEILHFTPKSLNPTAIHYNDILCIYQDYTGTIWLGTDGAGLSYFDENLNKFNVLTNYQTPNFANIDVVRAITVTNDHTIWIGTSGKGLTAYTPALGDFHTYTEEAPPPSQIPSNRIMSLLSDDESLYMGFQDEGLSVLKNGEVTNFNLTSTPSLPASTVWTIHKDANNQIWLGTGDHGIIAFDTEEGAAKQFKTSADPTSISSNTIRAVIDGAPGEMWIATETNGINRFLIASENFERFDQQPFQNIKSLYYESGVLWIGTNGQGLYAFDVSSEESYQFTTSDGLSNNVIYGILPDDSGNLWLSSNRGLTKFSVDQQMTPTVVNYDMYDGLQSFEFNTGAHFKDQDGTLYFGGLKGMNWFQPKNIYFNTSQPKTAITALEIFNESIPLVQNAAYAYNQNTVSFTFASLHFSQPDRNNYKYFLENYDHDWSKPTTTNFAHYAKLPPGNYTFKVVSSNYDEVWSDVPAIYSFKINSPWYFTIWAKLIYILLALTAIFVVYHYLKSRWQMQLQLRLEHEETERLKKLDELKSKLYTNISHEFRTPLTLISGPVQQLVSSSGLSTNDKKALHVIEGSSQRMLRLVNQMLDLSKLEEGSVTLHVTQQDLTPQITQLLEAFAIQAQEKGIGFISRLDAIKNAWYDKDVLEKVVSNLLSNAVKYAPENSAVIFTAEKRDDYLHIEIENDNKSLSSEEMEKLFERFYQADNNTPGVGVGLALIKELTTLSKGRLEGLRKSAKSIAFKVILPIEKECYNANMVVPKKDEYQFVTDTAPEIFDITSEETPVLLIVEDNLEIRKYIVSLFSENATILEAVNGAEGIEQAITHVPDLIISDVMMPIKNGVALCNVLKQDTRTSHIPIFLLTAKTGDNAMLEGLQSKADDYITKPFNAEILKQKVKNMLVTRLELRNKYSQHLYLSPKEIAFTSYDEQFLEQLQQVIDEHITDPQFKSDAFAEALGMSRMQLHRKLKALTNLSTSEFIRTQRLKASLPLLMNSGMTISEVAYSVGFNTPSYFTKCFKEVYNQTPAEYVSDQN